MSCFKVYKNKNEVISGPFNNLHKEYTFKTLGHCF